MFASFHDCLLVAQILRNNNFIIAIFRAHYWNSSPISRILREKTRQLRVQYRKRLRNSAQPKGWKPSEKAKTGQEGWPVLAVLAPNEYYAKLSVQKGQLPSEDGLCGEGDSLDRNSVRVVTFLLYPISSNL
jgi:hypothetical protein